MNGEHDKVSGDMEKTGAVQGKATDEATKMKDAIPPIASGDPVENSSASAKAAAEGGDGSGLDDRVQAHLGRLLRARYQELLEEPIPDKLKLHLDALSKGERKS